MNEELSHVGMEASLCIVCAVAFDTGAILLDTRLKKTLKHSQVTGWGMCEEHQSLKDKGYIALVSIDAEKSGMRQKDTNAQPGDVWRLGEIAHLKIEAFKDVFDVPLPKDGVCFVEPEVIEHLKAISPDHE